MKTDEMVIMKGAEFSDDRKYRYYLLRIWDDTKPFVMCIGLNPSTANEIDDDTTILNLCRLLREYGYGGFYMANLFALVSSEPNDLRSCPDPVKDNDKWLTYLEGITQEVIFCWGNFKQADYRAKKIIQRFPNALCLGKTPAGKPLHPLAATIWQKSKCKLQKFNTN
jgi:hypothetical protein